MVSFDVVSLFTNVPRDLAISVAARRLQSDDTLQDRSNLSVHNILSLLTICLDATFLSFRGQYYQQIKGTAMGSPVSVTVANMVVEDEEQRALATFISPPQFWKRYVDDTFTVIPEEMVSAFHEHLNSIDSNIQFTIEKESNCVLPFLDVLIECQLDGSVLTSVFRKPTHTDKYLDFQSHHPMSHKISVIRTLYSHARGLSSTMVQTVREEEHVLKVLKENGYPGCVIQRELLRSATRSATDPPYVNYISYAIARILRNLDITGLFSSPSYTTSTPPLNERHSTYGVP